jgi:hypothetical protein
LVGAVREEFDNMRRNGMEYFKITDVTVSYLDTHSGTSHVKAPLVFYLLTSATQHSFGRRGW